MTAPILTYRLPQYGDPDDEKTFHSSLRSDLETIARLGKTIVSLERIADALQSDRLHELENRVALSFDAGITAATGRQVEGILEILKGFGREHHVHTTLFVSGSGADFAPPAVQSAWLKAERSGLVRIENGGWIADGRPPADPHEASREISRASVRINAIMGHGGCRLYAYPEGRCNDLMANDFLPRFISQHHLKAAFSTEPATVARGDNRWRLPRFRWGRDWRTTDDLESLLKELKPRVQAATPQAPAQPPADTRYASYGNIWDFRARNEQAAMAAVDGSQSEATLQTTGGFVARQMRTALAISKSDTVLELGCGVGRIGRELAPHCDRWLGCDVSAKMLGVASQRLESLNNASFHHLTRSALTGISNNSIDKAYSVAVFCHMDKEDMFLYLQELCRVIKPGGWAYFETWNMAHPIGWKRWAYEVRQWAHSPQAGRKDVSRNQFSVPEEVMLLTEQAGLRIVSCYSDSPWVQMIASKQESEEDFTALLKYQERVNKRVEFDEQFTECFSRQLDLRYGAITASELLHWLDQQDTSATVSMYRDYLLAMWAANPEKWGPPPAS